MPSHKINKLTQLHDEINEEINTFRTQACDEASTELLLNALQLIIKALSHNNRWKDGDIKVS